MFHIKVLPGQTVVQSVFWTGDPWQARPPFRGAGFVHRRLLFWTPLPHLVLQSDHCDQGDQPPFTAHKQEHKEVYM